ncbi:MAG: B12-binding domain-containing radical SAM protein [Candidatus Omnitrophica bacterium]|nr:B12-binding domain-containing radical SAM protein [Candidatus Omnitrophota bacterium]
MRKMKVLLVRSPRYYWPFINEYDNFLLPQSLPCLAAALRASGISVKVIDCMPMKMGWKSLENQIKIEKPDVVGVGDSESMYSNEAVRVLKIARMLNPQVVTVAGGAHFSNLAHESLKEFPIDFIVKGEGEITFVELVKEISKLNPDFNSVNGILFRQEDVIIETAPRKLIENLDDLPLPAYDLMPMDQYGRAKYLFSPGGITIHHSRGCISNCDFCVWWVQMAEKTIENGEVKLTPRWRTKSVERTIEEIELLYYTYKKKFFIFVDDSWNIDPDWSNRFAEAILEKKMKINWFAFLRADCIIRDEKLGVMEKLVRSGLRHISVGGERAEDDELNEIGKKCYKIDMVKEALDIFRKKYPQVFTQVTFIVGVRNETKKTMMNQLAYAKSLKVDYPAFHPITPVPGTKLWDQAKAEGWLEITDFSYYDWSTPVMASKDLSRDQIDDLLYTINKSYASFWWLLKGLCSLYPHKRNMYIWWVLVVFKMFWDSLKSWVNPFKFKEYIRIVKPKWYDD